MLVLQTQPNTGPRYSSGTKVARPALCILTTDQHTTANIAYSTMQWPPWSNGGSDDRPKGRKSSEKTPPFNGPGDTLWIKYTAGSTLLLTSSILLAVRFYSKHLRRIPQATYIMPSVFRKRSLFGRVTRVGDADNFHMFHTPGGKWTGWGWFPGRKIPDKKDLKNQTVCSSSTTHGVHGLIVLPDSCPPGGG